MTDLQKQIEFLEAERNEAELLGALACNAETRLRNQRRAGKLRDEARALRRQVQGRAIAA